MRRTNGVSPLEVLLILALSCERGLPFFGLGRWPECRHNAASLRALSGA